MRNNNNKGAIGFFGFLITICIIGIVVLWVGARLFHQIPWLALLGLLFLVLLCFKKGLTTFRMFLLVATLLFIQIIPFVIFAVLEDRAFSGGGVSSEVGCIGILRQGFRGTALVFIGFLVYYFLRYFSLSWRWLYTAYIRGDTRRQRTIASIREPEQEKERRERKERIEKKTTED